MGWLSQIRSWGRGRPHHTAHRWGWLWCLRQVPRASVTSVRSDQAWLFSCARRKGYFFRSKSPGHSWKNYWKSVSKTWDRTNTSVFKRLKTAGELFFFCDAEEESHLVITVLKRKTRKEEKGKERKPFQGHLVCRGAGTRHCMGPVFLSGWGRLFLSPRVCGSPREVRSKAPGAPSGLCQVQGAKCVNSTSNCNCPFVPLVNLIRGNLIAGPPSHKPGPRPPTLRVASCNGLGLMTVMGLAPFA